jgi:hypothetical protein
VEEFTIWEIAAYADGLNRANGTDKPEAMSNDEFDDMLAAHGISKRAVA